LSGLISSPKSSATTAKPAATAAKSAATTAKPAAAAGRITATAKSAAARAAATKSAATSPTAARYQCRSSQSQRGHTAGQNQCSLQFAHNFHCIKVSSDSMARITRRRMRDTFPQGHTQLACQVS
jgi:hypothetical protein